MLRAGTARGSCIAGAGPSALRLRRCPLHHTAGASGTRSAVCGAHRVAWKPSAQPSLISAHSRRCVSEGAAASSSAKSMGHYMAAFLLIVDIMEHACVGLLGCLLICKAGQLCSHLNGTTHGLYNPHQHNYVACQQALRSTAARLVSAALSTCGGATHADGIEQRPVAVRRSVGGHRNSHSLLCSDSSPTKLRPSSSPACSHAALRHNHEPARMLPSLRDPGSC